jgi:hypothetical protein
MTRLPSPTRKQRCDGDLLDWLFLQRPALVSEEVAFGDLRILGEDTLDLLPMVLRRLDRAKAMPRALKVLPPQEAGDFRKIVLRLADVEVQSLERIAKDLMRFPRVYAVSYTVLGSGGTRTAGGHFGKGEERLRPSAKIIPFQSLVA